MYVDASDLCNDLVFQLCAGGTTSRNWNIKVKFLYVEKEVNKGTFFQKVMAKFTNLSNQHTCEPKIVSELLFPVIVINKIRATL